MNLRGSRENLRIKTMIEQCKRFLSIALIHIPLLADLTSDDEFNASFRQLEVEGIKCI